MIHKSKKRLLIETTSWVLLLSVIIFNLKLPIFNSALIFIPVAIYTISHLLRATRLWLVLFEEKLSCKTIFGLYVTTAIAGIIAPFKIGEILRISEIACVIGSVRKGIMVEIVNRFFDLVILLILAIISLLFGYNSSFAIFSPIVFLLVIVAVIVMIAYFAIPSFVTYGRHIIILRSRSDRGLKALAWLESLEELYNGVIRMIKGRSGMLLLLTLSVWLFELLAVYSLLVIFNSFSFSESFAKLFASLNIALGANYTISHN